MDDGRFRIGVHIADVSYFVDEKTDLDASAADRATSVYLVQKVIPMLPRVLCEDLCSLNPGEDRLAFSVSSCSQIHWYLSLVQFFVSSKMFTNGREYTSKRE